MTAINIGPLLLPLALLPWLAGLVLAWAWAVWRRRRHPDSEPGLWFAVLLAAVGARLGFVLLYLDQYQPFWWRLFDIRDGGWWWPGGVLGLLAGLWLAPGFRHGAQRAELWRSATVGAVPALLLTLILPLALPAPPLPDVVLQRANGANVSFSELHRRQLTLVNLWASWCPLCQRSVPLLQQARSEFPQVNFLLANQGENALTVGNWLLAQGLAGDNVLLDPDSALSRATGSPGLPTTLLYDADGTLLASHVGLLSQARLLHLLRPHLPASP